MCLNSKQGDLSKPCLIIFEEYPQDWMVKCALRDDASLDKLLDFRERTSVNIVLLCFSVFRHFMRVKLSKLSTVLCKLTLIKTDSESRCLDVCLMLRSDFLFGL